MKRHSSQPRAALNLVRATGIIRASIWVFAHFLTVSLLAAPPLDTPVGSPWTGEPGVHHSTAELMGQSQNAHQGSQRLIRARSKLDFQTLLANPQAPNLSSWPSLDGSGASSAATASPQTVGLSFTGATYGDTGAFPPDSMGAVGPSQFIVAVNGRIRSFNKSNGTADGVLDLDTDVFFQSVMTAPVTDNFTSDPRIRYDRLSGRWFIIMIDVPGRSGTLPNRVMVAVSNTQNITPATVWSYFFFRHDTVSPAGDSGSFADYPTLGIDANALYIGVNIFSSRGQGSFSSTTGFVVRKSSLLGAGPIVVTAFRKLVGKSQGVLTGLYTPQGVDNYDPAATEGYFIGVDPSFSGRLNLRRISNPGGTPTSSATIQITVPATGGTITVPHLGNSGGAAGNLDGLDIRLIAAHIRNGRLWTSANIAVDNTGLPSGVDTRNGVRWYELQGVASGQTPTVFQSGTVFQPSASNGTDQRSYWMGSIMVSGQGHAAMGFSVAGANERINAGTAGRLATDPLGTMQAPALYTASTTAYNPPLDPGGAAGRRWGDFSYTSLDPGDDMTMWTIQEFCNATDSYGVQVARLLAPPPATPVSCNPSSVAAGSTNIVVVVTGTSANGAGFFDPGVGFSNHITAAVNASGVTVQNVSYTDPTHLTVNLSVASNASSGSHTLTVGNPDGQFATSASAILTVVGGNNPPTISHSVNQFVDEDSIAALDFTVGDIETVTTSLTISASSSNTNLVPQAGFVFGGNGANRSVTITPAANQFGTSTITVTVADSNGGTASDSFLLTVRPVNDAPSFTKGINPTVFEDAGPQVVLNWATAISQGAANESGQTVNFIVTNNNNALFAVQPSIDANGKLTFTSAANASGTATVTAELHDNGGQANGGVDTSLPQTFTITVNPVNDAPVLAAIADRVIDEGETLTVTNIATDVDGPSLSFALEAAPAGAVINDATGVLTWTPGEEQGPSTNQITVLVTDNGSPGLTATQSFTVIVREVNIAPVLSPIANRTIYQGSTLSFTNSAADLDLPANELSYSMANAPTGATVGFFTGVFSWTPASEQANSTNEITMTVTDDGSPPLSHSRSFTVRVIPAPTITSISLAGTNLTLRWTAIDQRRYQVQYKSVLDETSWSDLSDEVIAAGESAMILDSVGAFSQRFYRVMAVP